MARACESIAHAKQIKGPRKHGFMFFTLRCGNQIFGIKKMKPSDSSHKYKIDLENFFS